MAGPGAGPVPITPGHTPRRTLPQMDPTLFWYVVATVLVLVGLAGVILPALPGLPLVFIGKYIGFFPRLKIITKSRHIRI